MNRTDRNLILEALAMAASRHESMARVQKHGRRHDQKAAAMRKLRHELHALALGETLVLEQGAAVTLHGGLISIRNRLSGQMTQDEIAALLAATSALPEGTAR